MDAWMLSFFISSLFCVSQLQSISRFILVLSSLTSDAPGTRPATSRSLTGMKRVPFTQRPYLGLHSDTLPWATQGQVARQQVTPVLGWHDKKWEYDVYICRCSTEVIRMTLVLREGQQRSTKERLYYSLLYLFQALYLDCSEGIIAHFGLAICDGIEECTLAYRRFANTTNDHLHRLCSLPFSPLCLLVGPVYIYNA